MALTREQVKEKLIALGISEPTEDQVTSFLNDVHSEANEEKKKAEKLKADAERAKQLEQELEKLKNQNLTDAEKQAKELEDAKKQIEELRQNNVLSEVKAIFGGAGLTEEDYKEYLVAFTGQEVETAKSMASSLVKTIENTRTQTEQKVKEKLLDNTRGGGGGGTNDDEKTEDVKFAEGISFGTTDKKTAEAARDFYK